MGTLQRSPEIRGPKTQQDDPWGFPWWSSGSEAASQCRGTEEFDPDEGN